MDVYLARQPIFNKKKEIFGYELLFRGGISNSFPNIDGNTASSNVLSNSFFSFGSDHITGGKKAFINFTEELLLKKIPLLFDKEILVVEILETVIPDEEVIKACQEIVDAGYQLALDDFVYGTHFDPLIKISGIIKIDVKSTQPDGIGELFKKLSSYPLKFLAEKVETYDEFEECLKLGFEYFQGYFFSKPQVLKESDISPGKLSYLQLLTQINSEDVDFSVVEDLISRDVSITYKLLRYINSAYYRRGKEISSLRQAIIILGEAGIRQFISVILMSSLKENKPHELMLTSVIRARFCELLSKNSDIKRQELFLLGLLSLLDAILDQSMESIMGKMPLSDSIKNALISGTGEMADFLTLVQSYETGDWTNLSIAANKIKMDNDKIPSLYWDSVLWADSIITD